MFKEHGVAVPKEIAGLMLSGFTSDTLLEITNNSPIWYKSQCSWIGIIERANLKIRALWLKAGTNLVSKSAEELIDIDKTFELNGNKVRVARVNTVDIAEVLERQAEIEAAMQAANTANGYSDFCLDDYRYVNSNSEISSGSNMDKVEEPLTLNITNFPSRCRFT